MSEKGEETGEETDPGLKVQAWHGTHPGTTRHLNTLSPPSSSHALSR